MDHDRLAIEFGKLKARVEPMLAEYEEHKAREAERDAKYAAHEATKRERDLARRDQPTAFRHRIRDAIAATKWDTPEEEAAAQQIAYDAPDHELDGIGAVYGVTRDGVARPESTVQTSG